MLEYCTNLRWGQNFTTQTFFSFFFFSLKSYYLSIHNQQTATGTLYHIASPSVRVPPRVWPGRRWCSIGEWRDRASWPGRTPGTRDTPRCWGGPAHCPQSPYHTMLLFQTQHARSSHLEGRAPDRQMPHLCSVTDPVLSTIKNRW